MVSAIVFLFFSQLRRLCLSIALLLYGWFLGQSRFIRLSSSVKLPLREMKSFNFILQFHTKSSASCTPVRVAAAKRGRPLRVEEGHETAAGPDVRARGSWGGEVASSGSGAWESAAAASGPDASIRSGCRRERNGDTRA